MKGMIKMFSIGYKEMKDCISNLDTALNEYDQSQSICNMIECLDTMEKTCQMLSDGISDMIDSLNSLSSRFS